MGGQLHQGLFGDCYCRPDNLELEFVDEFDFVFVFDKLDDKFEFVYIFDEYLSLIVKLFDFVFLYRSILFDLLFVDFVALEFDIIDYNSVQHWSL